MCKLCRGSASWIYSENSRTAERRSWLAGVQRLAFYTQQRCSLLWLSSHNQPEYCKESSFQKNSIKPANVTPSVTRGNQIASLQRSGWQSHSGSFRHIQTRQCEKTNIFHLSRQPFVPSETLSLWNPHKRYHQHNRTQRIQPTQPFSFPHSNASSFHWILPHRTTILPSPQRPTRRQTTPRNQLSIHFLAGERSIHHSGRRSRG